MEKINKFFLKRNLYAFLIFNFSLLIFTACGYKPSAHAIKNVFSDSVYVEVKVDRVEPENAPFLKDELNRIIYTRFKGHVTNKENAESHIIANYEGSSFTPLAYEDGYVTRYRANVKVRFTMLTKQGKLSKSISSRVESDIQASSITSSVLRTEAIREGLEKALDQFLAYVTATGMLKKDK